MVWRSCSDFRKFVTVAQFGDHRLIASQRLGPLTIKLCNLLVQPN